jgi:hypothetical protein
VGSSTLKTGSANALFNQFVTNQRRKGWRNFNSGMTDVVLKHDLLTAFFNFLFTRYISVGKMT